MNNNKLNTILQFNQINNQVEPTIINFDQVTNLVTSLVSCLECDVEGDVVEFGCFVGESSKYLRKTLDEYESDKKLYVYDSFEGLPELSKFEEGTGWKPGTLKSTEEILIANFENNELQPPIIHKDWFKDIPTEKLPEKISFAFLDGDFYDSIYDSLSKVYDRVTPGGFILFHDYDRHDLPGVKAAVYQFLQERGVTPVVDVLCDQLGLFKKPTEPGGLTLDEIIQKHGSDKFLSGYTKLYSELFEDYRTVSGLNYLEIGLGTLQPEIPSTFVGNPSHYPDYKPAGCLRAWKEYFTGEDVNIYGIDVAEDCMIEGDNITTFLGSSMDSDFCDKELADVKFDIILDDGLHTADGQIHTFRNLFNRVKNGGLYIIEDIGGGGDGTNVMIEYELEISEAIENHEYYYGGNVLVVRKSASGEGGKTWDDFRKPTSISVPLQPITPESKTHDSNMTIVSGLWNIDRVGRDWSRYTEHFDKFLKIESPMVLFIPAELEEFVWDRRSKENTFVKIYELEDIKNIMFSPFWDKWQAIRSNEEWVNRAGWLTGSPQYANEYYNPIVMSKMFFLHDASIWNHFDTDYFMWLDAGITQTCYENYFYNTDNLKTITEHMDPFLFLSYPYEPNQEIHGFEVEAIDRYAGAPVKYVCRGGLFGGHRDFLGSANADYWSLLDRSLSEGLAGTEESVFSIMAHLHPHNYRRYALAENGLIVKYMQDLEAKTAKLETIEHLQKPVFRPVVRDITGVNVSLYFLTFNYPEQLEYTIKSLQNHEGFLTHPKSKYIIDNSTNMKALKENAELCKKYGFVHLIRNENTGICGGRQFAAEHFAETDADYYLFFEDDMTIADPEEGICRNGFRKYIPNLYEKLLKIMIKEEFDFLKLSYTEVYMDNNIQVSWYNVPQGIRDRDWPEYNQLPINGLDPHCPRTKFDKIEVLDGVSYISGDIYYANWPHITSKTGNKKMFLDNKWTHPYEQTWMSHIYQETLKDNIKPGILLASPVTHERFKHYAPEERIES